MQSEDPASKYNAEGTNTRGTPVFQGSRFREDKKHFCPGAGKEGPGFRYKDATISNLKLSNEDSSKIFNWMKKGEHFLIYQGIAGCGKTHLCYAIENDARKFGNFRYMRHWKEYTFFERIRSAIERGVDYNFETQYLIDDDFVVYDDLGSIGIKDWRNEVLFSFIDSRYTSKKPTVITTNLTESEIREKLGFRIHSRLFSKENTILNFGELDLRQLGN